jgi:hypothetical protein
MPTDQRTTTNDETVTIPMDKLRELVKPVHQVIELCRRYGTPATEPGAHALARKILRLLGDDVKGE